MTRDTLLDSDSDGDGDGDVGLLGLASLLL